MMFCIAVGNEAKVPDAPGTVGIDFHRFQLVVHDSSVLRRHHALYLVTSCHYGRSLPYRLSISAHPSQVSLIAKRVLPGLGYAPPRELNLGLSQSLFLMRSVLFSRHLHHIHRPRRLDRSSRCSSRCWCLIASRRRSTLWLLKQHWFCGLVRLYRLFDPHNVTRRIKGDVLLGYHSY